MKNPFISVLTPTTIALGVWLVFGFFAGSDISMPKMLVTFISYYVVFLMSSLSQSRSQKLMEKREALESAFKFGIYYGFTSWLLVNTASYLLLAEFLPAWWPFLITPLAIGIHFLHILTFNNKNGKAA